MSLQPAVCSYVGALSRLRAKGQCGQIRNQLILPSLTQKLAAKAPTASDKTTNS